MRIHFNRYGDSDTTSLYDTNTIVSEFPPYLKQDLTFLESIKTKLERLKNIEANSNSYDLTLPGHNYLGPGTRVVTNLINDLLPTDEADFQALVHDFNYAKSNNHWADVFKADYDFQANDFESAASKTLLMVKDVLEIPIKADIYNMNKPELEALSQLLSMRIDEYNNKK